MYHKTYIMTMKRVSSNNQSKKSKKGRVKTEKGFSVDKSRNKENLYFLKYYYQNSLDNQDSVSIVNEMFDCIELNYVQHTYNGESMKETTTSTTTRFTIDKNSNLVYEKQETNTATLFGYYCKSIEMKDKKRRKWNRIDIYDKKKQHKFIVYPEHQEFEIIQDVFDEYKNIIEIENDVFKCSLDDEIAEVISEIKNADAIEDKDAKMELKKKLCNIITNLCNSNLDITEETYEVFNNFMSKF
jgi:hypothetical protein